MNGSEKECLYEPMTRYLEAQIAAGAYRPGDRLPPLRSWCEKFNINLDTARRGMWHLQNSGLLECRRSSGIYVRDFGNALPLRNAIGVLLQDDDPSQTYCAHVMLGIQQRAKSSKTPLCRLTKVVPGNLCRSRHLLEKELAQCSALILLGNYDLDSEDLSWLRRPAIGVEMHEMCSGLFSVISMDPVNAAELAVEYFRRHNKKHVRIIDLTTPLHRFRAAVFQDHFMRTGGTVEYHEVNPCCYNPDLLSDPGCGYLFTGGECFQLLAEQFPGDLATERTVISLDAKSEWLPGYRPVSTIGPDWRQIGVLACEEAERRARTPGSMAKRIYADVKLYER